MNGNATKAAVKQHGLLRLSSEFFRRPGHARLASRDGAGRAATRVGRTSYSLLAAGFWGQASGQGGNLPWLSHDRAKMSLEARIYRKSRIAVKDKNPRLSVNPRF